MKTLRRIILHELRPYLLVLSFILFLMLVVVALQAAAPWPFKFLIDNVLGDETISTKTFIGWLISLVPSQELLGYIVVLIFFLISMGSSIVEYFQSKLLRKVIRGIIFDFSKSAFSQLEGFDMGFFRNQDIGDYIYRLNYDVGALGELIEEGILPIISSAFYLIFTAILMFTISYKLALIAFLALPFLATGLYIFNKRIEVGTKRSEFSNSTVFTFVQQILSQLKIVQVFSQEKNESKEFNLKLKKSLQNELLLYNLNFLLSLLVGAIIAISYSLIIGIGIHLFFLGEFSTGLLIVFIFYLDNLTQPLLDIIYASSAFKESYVRIERMKDFFNKRNQLHNTGIIKELSDTTIQFHNVILEGNQGMKILHNISFTIPENKMTVLVGVSGSGKTSVISLIPRLLSNPQHGEILLGDKNINTYDVMTLRKNIAYVPQENLLFNQSIFEIIAFGVPHATLAEVKYAAKLAYADEFIEKHPQGYNFRVGDEGNYLSGGQRQRLMIARAFMRKTAKILIFDEPLSSLDIQTRKDVWKSIKTFAEGKTTILVSNVLDVITNADQILFLNDGRLAEQGNHKKLLEKSNLYTLFVEKE
ncbi:MAG TPA: ABC transporter ATP-binding protein [Patescibacteria group bacterium]|nr:ABC transporter ATP-binding protein [Patescibacteria group bacterium]